MCACVWGGGEEEDRVKAKGKKEEENRLTRYRLHYSRLEGVKNETL